MRDDNNVSVSRVRTEICRTMISDVIEEAIEEIFLGSVKVFNGGGGFKIVTPLKPKETVKKTFGMWWWKVEYDVDMYKRELEWLVREDGTVTFLVFKEGIGSQAVDAIMQLAVTFLPKTEDRVNIDYKISLCLETDYADPEVKDRPCYY